MTARAAARTSRETSRESAKASADVSREVRALSPQRLDRVIHDRTRLAILAALAASDAMSFTDLKAATDTTDGNLSVHARRLEEAGYVICEKTFVGRTPRTEYRLSATGRRAFVKYLDHMDALVRATKPLAATNAKPKK